MRRRRATVLAVALGLALGCGEDEGGITVADLVGTWTATKFEFTNRANPAQKIDLVPFGLSFTLVVAPGGRYTMTMSFPGQPGEVEQGVVSVAGDSICVDPDGPEGQECMAFTLAGDTLTVTGDGEFDFNGDGVDDPAVMLLVLRRTGR